MAVSVYFNNTRSVSEQRLFERLSVEMINHMGVDTYYLPRTTGNLDEVFSEDTTSSFNRAFLIEMYVKDSYKGFSGTGDLMTNAGPEINDKITLVVARKTFINEIGDYIGNQPRPNEGDLVFLKDLDNKAFRITFVEHESVFYQAGSLYVWELECELYSYGGETFDTGIPEIDGMTAAFDLNLLGTGLVLENADETSLAFEDDGGLPLFTEEVMDEVDPNLLNEKNDFYEVAGKTVIDFSEVDVFLGTPEY